MSKKVVFQGNVSRDIPFPFPCPQHDSSNIPLYTIATLPLHVCYLRLVPSV